MEACLLNAAGFLFLADFKLLSGKSSGQDPYRFQKQRFQKQRSQK